MAKILSQADPEVQRDSSSHSNGNPAPITPIHTWGNELSSVRHPLTLSMISKGDLLSSSAASAAQSAVAGASTTAAWVCRERASQHYNNRESKGLPTAPMLTRCAVRNAIRRGAEWAFLCCTARSDLFACRAPRKVHSAQPLHNWQRDSSHVWPCLQSHGSKWRVSLGALNVWRHTL